MIIPIELKPINPMAFQPNGVNRSMMATDWAKQLRNTNNMDDMIAD